MCASREIDPVNTKSVETQSSAPIPGGNTVLVEFEDGIAWVTINRPEKRNAMSPTLADEMLAVLTRSRSITAAGCWCSPAPASRSRPAWT